MTPGRREVVAGIAATVLLAGLGRRAWAVASTEPAAELHRLSPALDRIVAPGTPIETIATGIRWAEGPVWVPRGGYLLFSDPPANVMRRWQRGQGTATFLSPSGQGGTDPKLVREAGSNGLGLDAAGRLLIANSGGRSLDALDLATGKRRVLADRYQGKRFNSPNDLTVSRSGAIYFTDPPYGFAGGDSSSLKEQPHNGVYRWRADGQVDLVDGSLTRPNGVALSPDERQLFVSVSDEKAPRVMVHDLDARGLPAASRVWLDAAAMHGPGLPDGMKVASDGTHFQSVPGGMGIFTRDAEPLGLIANGGPIANCCFGEGGRALYLTANDRVLRLALRPGWSGGITTSR